MDHYMDGVTDDEEDEAIRANGGVPPDREGHKGTDDDILLRIINQQDRAVETDRALLGMIRELTDRLATVENLLKTKPLTNPQP